jgi:transcriptional regulator with XRE-family HTH domain
MTDGRRPLRVHERAHVERLGRLLATTRRAVGLTQEQVALRAGLSRTHLDRLERGLRRTRRSTLARIAVVLVHEEPRLGPVERLVDDLVAEAGPALAEESAYAERVARRRSLRQDVAHRRFEQQEELRLRRYLVEIKYGPRRWMYTADEIDELWAEMFDYLARSRAEREERRRQIESVQRRSS